MRARHLMILVLAEAAGACGAEVQPGAGADGQQVLASVTAPPSPSVAPPEDATATIEAGAIRDCGELAPPAEGEGFSSAELEAARDEIRPLMTGSGVPGEPFVFGIGIGNALKLATVDAVGDFDVLAERLAAVVSDPERVCLQTTPLPDEDDAEPAQWLLASSPDPADTTLGLNIVERACSGGGTADGRVVADVTETASTIEITVAVVPKPGVNPCPGNSTTFFTITLDEPVGDRRIVVRDTGDTADVGDPNDPTAS